MIDATKNFERYEFPGWPAYDDDEIRAAERVLRSGQVNYWTGEEGRCFEEEFAGYLGVRHAIAVSNGSVALGLALRALRFEEGAEVIVTPRTFIASVSEIVIAGAVPVFADIDRDSQNISRETIEPLINARTAAIMTVHLAGQPCDMPGITALAAAHGIAVIEDCAQSHGAAIGGRKVGAWGDLAAFSFCQDKIMSTGGEGGMVVTNNDEYWRYCWSFKDHGKSAGAMKERGGTVFRWVHDSIGTNGRMTEFQAAIGRKQLKKLDDWVDRRNHNAAVLVDRLSGAAGLRLVRPPQNLRHAYYKFNVFIKPETLAPGWTRDRMVAELASYGVPCGSGICPEVYMEQAFADLVSKPAERLPVARALGETSLMFPVHPTLTDAHMGKIADALTSLMAQATQKKRRSSIDDDSL
jgi:dTDP-4-amino-4,6-dideoxygalactose transaminase